MTVKDASLSSRSLSLDHQSLSQMLIERENILIIQDLDGVCMGLVKDPLTRVMEARYLESVKALGAGDGSSISRISQSFGRSFFCFD